MLTTRYQLTHQQGPVTSSQRGILVQHVRNGSTVKVVAKVIATAFLPPYSQCYFNELGVVYR
jgi:hypothetical protein